MLEHILGTLSTEFTDVEREMYSHGGCDLLAIAIARITNWPIYSMLEVRQLTDTLEMPALVHCFTLPDRDHVDMILDAKGYRPAKDLQEEYYTDYRQVWVEETNEAKLRDIIYPTLEIEIEGHAPDLQSDEIVIQRLMSKFKKGVVSNENDCS